MLNGDASLCYIMLGGYSAAIHWPCSLVDNDLGFNKHMRHIPTNTGLVHIRSTKTGLSSCYTWYTWVDFKWLLLTSVAQYFMYT